MNAYKKFNSQDVYVSTYTAKKNWIVSGSQYSDYGVVSLAGISGSRGYNVSDGFLFKNYDRRLVYESIRHLYYSSFKDGEILTSSSFENYLQSSFNTSGSRDINEVLSIYSLSRDTYGTAVQPKSIEITPDGDTEQYVEYDADLDTAYAAKNPSSDYARTTIERNGSLYGAVRKFGAGVNFGPFAPPVLPGHTEKIIDDGEGNLFLTDNRTNTESKRKVGNIIYPQGQVIITDDEVARYYNNYTDGQIKWKSTHPIYTYNFHCKLKESEFTHTFNPSAMSGSNGDIAQNVAGEEFSPYITTVGLYNDANELIAVAKTGQPIPIPKDSDMTIVAKIDI